MMDRAQRLGEGSIPGLLLRFSAPAMAGTVAQALYYIVDRIFIGWALGRSGLAGITVAFPHMLALLAFGMLIGFGAAAVVSIRLGERRKDAAEQVLGNAMVLLLAASAVLTVAGLIWLDPLLVLFGASETVLPYARDYLQIIVMGTVFQVFGFGLNAVIRGEGNPQIAMLTLLIGVLLNTALAPILIFVLGWGMRGAALATVISQAVSAAWVAGYFLSGRSLLRLRAENLRLRLPICAEVLTIGSPHFAMQLAASLMNSLLNNQLRVYGDDVAVSALGVLYSVAMMIFMPIFGINQGAQPIIGYNFGARKFDRVRRTLQTAVLAASSIAVAGFVVAVLFPAQIIRLFEHEDAALAAMGVRALRISTVMWPLVGFQTVSASYFQAVGKPTQALLLMLSRQVLIFFPAALVLPYFFGVDGVWMSLPAADLGSSILTGTCLLFELRHLRDRHLATNVVEAGAVAPVEESVLP